MLPLMAAKAVKAAKAATTLNTHVHTTTHTLNGHGSTTVISDTVTSHTKYFEFGCHWNNHQFDLKFPYTQFDPVSHSTHVTKW